MCGPTRRTVRNSRARVSDPETGETKHDTEDEQGRGEEKARGC